MGEASAMRSCPADAVADEGLMRPLAGCVPSRTGTSGPGSHTHKPFKVVALSYSFRVRTTATIHTSITSDLCIFSDDETSLRPAAIF